MDAVKCLEKSEVGEEYGDTGNDRVGGGVLLNQTGLFWNCVEVLFYIRMWEFKKIKVVSVGEQLGIRSPRLILEIFQIITW